MLIRRTTRYEPPTSHCPLLSASVGIQTCVATAAGSSALTFMVPSLKPIRFRGVAWLVEVDDVRPKPSCDHLIAARPNAMRARLRTACTATWGSSAQAWTHRSPSDRNEQSLACVQLG